MTFCELMARELSFSRGGLLFPMVLHFSLHQTIDMEIFIEQGLSKLVLTKNQVDFFLILIKTRSQWALPCTPYMKTDHY